MPWQNSKDFTPVAVGGLFLGQPLVLAVRPLRVFFPFARDRDDPAGVELAPQKGARQGPHQLVDVHPVRIGAARRSTETRADWISSTANATKTEANPFFATGAICSISMIDPMFGFGRNDYGRRSARLLIGSLSRRALGPGALAMKDARFGTVARRWIAAGGRRRRRPRWRRARLRRGEEARARSSRRFRARQIQASFPANRARGLRDRAGRCGEIGGPRTHAPPPHRARSACDPSLSSPAQGRIPRRTWHNPLRSPQGRRRAARARALQAPATISRRARLRAGTHRGFLTRAECRPANRVQRAPR